MKVSILRKNGYEVVNLNRRRSIRECCLNCSGYEYKAVANCEFSCCPLFHFRFGHGKQDSQTRAKAIRRYCLGCVLGRRSEVSNCPCKDCSLFPYRQSVVDRAAEIKSLAETAHIEAISEDKMISEYSLMHTAQ